MKKLVCAVLFFGASLGATASPDCRTLLTGMPFAIPSAMLPSLSNGELYLPAVTQGSKIQQWVQRHLAGGKRLRPMAVYLSGLAMGIETSQVEKLAGVVEQIHLGSLALDDIIDDAEERRGRPPLHVAEGLTAGIITGPYLQACVFLECEEHSNAAVRKELARTLKAMGDAEILQRDLKERVIEGYSRREYEQVALGKTGYLFGLSLAIAGLHFEMPGDLVQEWMSLGRQLGVAYQIKDDFSDALEEPNEVNFALLLFSLAKGGSPFRQLSSDEYSEVLQWQSGEQLDRRQEMLATLESIRGKVGEIQNANQVAAFDTLHDMILYVTSP